VPTKLHQIIAITTGLKAEYQKVLTLAHNHQLKLDMVTGLVRTYKPLDDTGDKLPSETKIVQTTVVQVLKDIKPSLIEAIDAVYTQDVGNTRAKADLKIADQVVKDIPVTHLLYLEKRLVDLETFVEKLPVLDAAEVWEPDNDVGLGGHTTAPYETLKRDKVKKAHILYPATDHHPAQVESYTVDETVGIWTNIKKSGALRSQDKVAMLDRIKSLRNAVKFAREAANDIEVEQMKIGSTLLDYIFGI
jgi:hypothetical protein